MLWQGAIVDIPRGWVLCDGLNEAPDLRDEMVIGSQGIYEQDVVGGSSQHNHPFTGDSHTHSILDDSVVDRGSGFERTTDSESTSGSSDNSANLPPYYSLAYIMFVGD